METDNIQVDQVPVEQGAPAPQQPSQDDLISRVTDYKASEPKPEVDINPELANSQELQKAIEAIEDPNLRDRFSNLRKSLMRGTNEKFQEIAEIRKELQAMREGNSKWTVEKVQSLINNPEFVEAAKKLAPEPEEESLLSEKERQALAEVNVLKSELSKLKSLQNDALRRQQHDALKSKYKDYDPKEIDTITYEMLEGKIQATPEHIYKAFKYEDSVRRAYELGRKDEREGIKTKSELSSYDGIQSNVKSDTIEPQENESNQSFLNRIIQKNLKALSQKS